MSPETLIPTFSKRHDKLLGKMAKREMALESSKNHLAHAGNFANRAVWRAVNFRREHRYDHAKNLAAENWEREQQSNAETAALAEATPMYNDPDIF